MIASFTSAGFQTSIVVITLIIGLLITMRRRSDSPLFPPAVTTELKGLAILLVMFVHIGYFLVADHQFLVPLSNYSGVGVDLFLLLSGYGLVASALKRPLTRWQFYKKRLLKIYLPVLLTVILFLVTDFFILHHSHPLSENIKNLFGFFPSADLFGDSNSPLWFITPLLAFYILFPLVFSKRYPFLSACALWLIAWIVARQDISALFGVTAGVANLYQLHLFSFPVGVAIGALANQPPLFVRQLQKLCAAYCSTNFLRTFFGVVAAIVLAFTLQYTAVGQGWGRESFVSICSCVALLIVFVAKKVEFGFLSLFGALSFELYLLHWPLLYHYDPLYTWLPAGFATVFSLTILVALSWVYLQGINKLTRSK